MEEEEIKKMELLLDELHKIKFELLEDFDQDNTRIVMLKKRNIYCTLQLSTYIKYDVYAELTGGVYELGDLHSLTRNMLNLKKLLLSFEAEEINTTERLYPENRRGKHTTTSDL